MKTKLDISIPTPCHEAWENMQANELGRYCLACQKTVIDFTQKSEKEIAEILLKSEGKICGRFLESQLKPIYLPEPQIGSSHLKAYLFAFANMILASWLMPTQAQGQEQIKSLIKENPIKKLLVSTTQESEQKQKESDRVQGEDLLEKNIKNFNCKPHFINGFISTYLDSLPIVSAEIKLNGKVIAKTDNKGYFEIEIAKMQFVSEELSLTFSAFGYEDLEQKVSITQAQNLHLQLNEAVCIQGLNVASQTFTTGIVAVVSRELNFLERALLKIRNLAIKTKNFFVKKPK